MKLKGIQLGRVLGIPVRLHFTFPFFLVVIVAVETYGGGWRAGLHIAGVLISLFIFVLLHELGHSVVARRYGIPILDITLLPIGGVARTLGLPKTSGQEIAIALAGPAVNYVLAIPLGIAVATLPEGALREFAIPLLFANLMLGTFNLIPAFPMDGGRVLRALLALRKDYLDATRIAVWVGRVVAVIFVVVAVMDRQWILLALIALFIYNAGGGELRLARRLNSLAKGSAQDAAAPLPPAIPGDASLGRAWTWLESFPYAPYFAIEVDPITITLVDREELGDLCLALRANMEIARVALHAEIPLAGKCPLVDARGKLKEAHHNMLPVRMPNGSLGLLTLMDLEAWLGD
jgi:Zn-dependent protease